MALNVFIGWSGRKSFPVAKKLAVWLEEVIPNIETWMSEEITPGTVAWFNDLNERLRQADFAVICVNPDNWDNPWLSYEPGVVIGKRRKETRVCPYLIDPYALRRNLPEPLKLFWAEKPTDDGTYNLVKIIYEAANGLLSEKSEKQLKRVFNKKWRELEKVILDAAGPPPPPPSPEPADYIDDFMKVSRRIESHRDRLYGQFHEVIRKAVKAIRAGAYDSKAIVGLAASEIRKSKERFIDDNSLLVGNVCAFFESYYTEDDLQRAITEMELALEIDKKQPKKPPKPRTLKELESLREGWETYMQVAVAKIFSEYHRLLLGKLNNYLGSIESRNKRSA
jgi:hypothetical protein